jgi:hypothetical protein
MKRSIIVVLVGILSITVGGLCYSWPGTPCEDDPDSRPVADASTATAGDAQTAAKKPPSGQVAQLEGPAFWGTRLVNLPTTTLMEKGDILFRISHRFYGPVDEGYDRFFGLDSGANVLFSLGYGISDHVGITIGRARLFQEWEFGLNWLAVEQGVTAGLPFSAAFHAGLDWATLDGSGYLKFSLQVSLSRQMGKRLSFLVVPAFSTNTNFWAPEPEGTISIGVGSRYMIFNNLSIIAEWTPVIAGYSDVESGWGLGLEKKIGRHVFQVFVTNSFGLTGSQFVPGGDLQIADFDFRIGFNIFRTF